MSNNVYQSESIVYDNLLLMGQMSVVTDTLMVDEGCSLKRGSVVGLDARTRRAYLVDRSKSDGTEVPFAVIAEDVSEDGTLEIPVYLAGEFNADALIVGSGTIDDYKYDMRKIGLFVRDVQNRGI